MTDMKAIGGYMSDEDRLRLLDEKINTLTARIERSEMEIGHGHADLMALHSDRLKIFEKLEENQKMIVGNERDISHSKELFLSKIEDIKNENIKESEKIRKDVNALWENFRKFKDEIKTDMKGEFESLKNMINTQDENGLLKNRVWVAIIVISLLMNVVVIFLAKYWG